MIPRINRQYLPILATTVVCILLYTAAAIHFREQNFFSLGVLVNFFVDNAYLGIAAIGATFVILAGGIDLSVGSVLACAGVLAASLIENHHWHPVIALPVVLVLGIMFGLAQGALIRFFDLPPFLVTLAGLFFARGVALIISTESISITHPWYSRASDIALPLGGGNYLPLVPMLFIALVLAATYCSLWRDFGRNVYALGGNEQSANLMGLPVGLTKLLVYGVGGFCSALAGIAHTLELSSGNATAATGLELDAIAAVVVGGTLLSGGVGYVPGTLLGVLIFGIITTVLNFQGNLSSWWTKIAIGVLLLVFIVLQKLLQRGAGRG